MTRARPFPRTRGQRGSVTVAAAVGALLLAAGLVGLGFALSWGLQQFRAAERSVEVKGLSEREVPATLAIWTLTHGDADADGAALYPRLEARNAKIVAFLGERGFEAKELTVGAPQVVDRQAQEFGEQGARLRYFGKASVTVYTARVDAVRKALGDLGELGRRGVAVSVGGENGGEENSAGAQLPANSAHLAHLRELHENRELERLFELVFPGEVDVKYEAIEVVVYRLRKKLSGTGMDLVTLRGLGYLLKPTPPGAAA